MWNLSTAIIMGIARMMFAPPVIFIDPRSMSGGEFTTLIEDLRGMSPGRIIRVPEHAYIRWLPWGNLFQLPRIVNMTTDPESGDMVITYPEAQRDG